MSIRVGTICYAVNSGLGILAKSFFDNRIVNNVVVIEHAHHPNHLEWYPGFPAVPIREVSYSQSVKDLCDQMDVMLFFETPFDIGLIEYCRRHNTKTVLMPMHECFREDWFDGRNVPDLYLCPSELDYEVINKNLRGFAVVRQISVPVSVPWRQRNRAEMFVHNAGHGGLKGRNGTEELINAMRYVKSDVKLIIRSQKELRTVTGDNRIKWEFGTRPYDQLYSEGDVFVFVEKFNGLSLPLQEAYASGMLVMGTNRFPMNEWLPKEPLIPVSYYTKDRIGPPYLSFSQANVDPNLIAKTIDDWFGKDITEYSLRGKQWAEENSWKKLGPKYREILESLL